MTQEEEDFKLITEALNVMKEHNLEVELVYYAISYMKENNKLTVAEAVNAAFYDMIH